MADISKIKTLDGTTYDLKDAVARYHLPYGECETPTAFAAKTVTIDGITELTAGLTIAVKFIYPNSANTPTLNLNSLGAKSIRQYGTTSAGTTAATSGWHAGDIVLLVYDGTAWYFNKGFNSDNNTTYTITSVFCNTPPAEAAKVTTYAVYYALRAGNVFEITMQYANTYQGAITLNVNNTGAKPIWINDAETSARNYTLPAGKYLVYYNGAQYRFRTDGKQPISISGTVNGYSLHKTVPSDAVFTDTTYDAATATPLMDGTGTVGTSEKYAREDHRHPTDTSRAAASHTHSANDITGGYLNIHPENSPTIVPFINNDIAFLTKRGGSAVVTYDGVVQTVDISNVFDGSGSYFSINSIDLNTVVIELTLHTTFGWTNTIYIDFGGSGWRAKSVKIEVMNTSYSGDVWTQKYSTTTNALGHVYVNTSHTPVGASNAGGGFNKLRFTLSDFNSKTSSGLRIAQIGIYNYGSKGTRETYMSRGIDDQVFRSITPNVNNTYSLGSSSNKWSNVYTNTLNGTTIPTSPKFTDTIIEPATEAPLANMDATVGTSLKYAREDHRHPATKIPPIWCDTLSAESAKVANGNSGYYYSLREGNVFICSMYYANTAQSALTFRVGTTGAKPIYINGTASSSTNYTLPAGSYIVYYDGTAYHFRTDGKIPGPITNNATSSAAGLMSAADKSKLDVITGVAVSDTEPTSDSILAWIDTDSTDTVTLLTQSEVNAQYVSYDHSQTLTSAQQNRALQNIGISDGTDAQKTNLATFAGISLTVVGTI